MASRIGRDALAGAVGTSDRGGRLVLFVTQAVTQYVGRVGQDVAIVETARRGGGEVDAATLVRLVLGHRGVGRGHGGRQAAAADAAAEGAGGVAGDVGAHQFQIVTV